MSGILWGEIVFGPIKSRRLGNSLGINLLPGNLKICTFNCIYCECGWGDKVLDIENKIFGHKEIIETLEKRLKELKANNTPIDSFTFAGNGEPTMHPYFAEIVDDIVALRDQYYPNAKTSCLSNSTMVMNPKIRTALMKLDNVLLKLDAGTQEMFNNINMAFDPISIIDVVENLKLFKGNLSIQTLFLTGENNGNIIDNTSEKEVSLWLKHIQAIAPKKVVIYPIDRATPAINLNKVSPKKLNEIAERVRALGIVCEVIG